MRIRIILSFLLVISISLLGVSILVRQNAQHEVQTFLGRGGLIGAESLVDDLEAWYRVNQSWAGAEALMPANDHDASGGAGAGGGSGPGGPQQGQRRLNTIRLADAEGIIIYDPVNAANIGTASANDAASIALTQDGVVVGYLLPQEDSYAQENALFEARFLERINRASLIAAMISGAAALVLALLLAYFLTKPVNQLVEATEGVARGNLSYRVDIDKPKEFARLGGTFNRMAQELQEAEKRRKNLTSDIAHELRTPLAVQRAHLEAMADGVFPLTKENLLAVQDQNHLLNRLVEDLRLLTLADAGQLELDMQLVDMYQVISDVIEQFGAKAREKKIVIEKDLQHCPMVRADAQRIQQIIQNLLQNGVRYTPEGGTLFIQLMYQGGKVICSVRDTGEGIPDAALPYIFDRFYRAERSRTKVAGGTGLGLAIARNLAEVHHGSLSAKNHPEGGAEFVLTLPVGEQAS